MSGNYQMQCLGRSLCCNALQRCPFSFNFCARVSPSLWGKKLLHCSREACRYNCMRRSWVSHWIVGGAVTVFPPAIWLGTRGGHGNSLPSCSSLQLIVTSTSESTSLPSCAGYHMEGRAGRSFLSVLFPVCTPWIFHCPIPGG